MKNILILDMSYTLKMFRDRQLGQALDSRKLGGYFSSVISVHPLAGLFEEGAGRYGEPVVTNLDNSHVFVEGKVGIGGMCKFLPPIGLLFAQIKLLRLLLRMSRTMRVSIVRVGDPYYLGLVGLFLARKLKVPLAIRVCLNYDEMYKVSGKPLMPRLFRYRWVEKLIERFVFPRCDLIAGANEDNMRYALRNGGRAEIATVFRYGNLIHASHWLAPDKRRPADVELAEFALEEGKFVVTVSRLVPMKCIDDGIRAVAELIRRGHNIKYLIIGDGTSRRDLENLARTLGVDKDVIFSGNRQQEWISAVLPRAAAVISPHMGRALSEAALAGVPIVAYDYDWQREIIKDGQTGYLVPHKDWVGLCNKTESILNNPADSKKMGDNAREKVLEMMDPVKLDLHEREEYARLLERFSKL